MRRVAYVVPRFPKVSETFILNEILELQRRGVEVELMALVRERARVSHPGADELLAGLVHPRGDVPGVLRAQLHWLRYSPRRYAGLWARAVWGNRRSPKFLARALAAVPAGAFFARHVERSGAGHVHAHYATHSALTAMVAAELAGVPFSFTAHAHDLYVDTAMLAEKLRAARFVVTISEYNRALLAEQFDASNVVVVRTGALLDAFAAEPPVPPADGRPFDVLCVASLEPYKGQKHLIAAVAAMGLSVRLTLVGEGCDRAALEALADRLGAPVRFLGAQPRDRVASLLASCDAVCLPSIITASGKREGIPVALMEAMASGRPVVATRISGIPELVEDEVTGLLVEPEDPGALAAALGRLRDDPALCERLAAGGRERVAAEYDLRENVGLLAELFVA